MEHLHDVVGCRTLFTRHIHEFAETQGQPQTAKLAQFAKQIRWLRRVCSEMRSICAGWANVADTMPRAVCMAMDAAAGRHGDVSAYRIGPRQVGQSHGLKAAALAGHTFAARSDPAA